MDKLIMKLQIFGDESQNSELKGPYGEVAIIPFTGKVESQLFTGEILPGGVDVQVQNRAGSRNMCAKYMFLGKDSTGNTCLNISEGDCHPLLKYFSYPPLSTLRT